MKIRKEDAKVVDVAAKERVHYVVNFVRFEPGRMIPKGGQFFRAAKLIATDGRIMVVREVEMEEDEKEFKPFHLHSKDFKELAAKSGLLRVEKKDMLSFRHTTQKHSSLKETGVICSISPEKEEEDGKNYPDYSRAIPPENQPEGKSAKFSPNLFVTLMKAFKGCGEITITVVAPDQPLRVDGILPDGRKIVGVIMPLVEHRRGAV